MFFLGIDEAGLGPNLGPLVVSVTKWELPQPPAQFDFYGRLADVVSRESSQRGTRLHIADSKLVHSSSGGLAALERSALVLLRVAGCPATTLTDLIQWLMEARWSDEVLASEPGLGQHDIPLPSVVPEGEIRDWTTRLAAALQREQVGTPNIASEVVFTRRFNELVTALDNKSLLLSRTSLGLLGQQWDPCATQPTLIIGDKHGGRNRYDVLLSEWTNGTMILRMEEGLQRSCYRVGATEVRFQVGGEEHFPVACASLVSKYVRELCMDAFNAYWTGHVPGLAPTKGYPQDAKRFRDQTAALRQQLGIPESDFWRCR